MGSSQSSQAKQTIEVLNKSVTNMVKSSTNSASAKNTNTNNFRIKIGEKGDVINCDIDLTQKIKATQAVKVMAKYTSTADLQTQLKTALQSSAEQASKSEQQSLATTIGVQNSKTEINQKINNIVETSIKDEVFNTVNGFLDNLNVGTLEILGKYTCGPKGTIVINQDIVSDQIVELLSDSIISNVAKTSTDSAASATSKQTSESLQTGMISDLGKALMGPMGIVAIVLIVFLLIGAFTLYLMKDSLGGLADTALKMSPMGLIMPKSVNNLAAPKGKLGMRKR